MHAFFMQRTPSLGGKCTCFCRQHQHSLDQGWHLQQEKVTEAKENICHIVPCAASTLDNTVKLILNQTVTVRSNTCKYFFSKQVACSARFTSSKILDFLLGKWKYLWSFKTGGLLWQWFLHTCFPYVAMMGAFSKPVQALQLVANTNAR